MTASLTNLEEGEADRKGVRLWNPLSQKKILKRSLEVNLFPAISSRKPFSIGLTGVALIVIGKQCR
jgi:hypothetical protein